MLFSSDRPSVSDSDEFDILLDQLDNSVSIADEELEELDSLSQRDTPTNSNISVDFIPKTIPLHHHQLALGMCFYYLNTRNAKERHALGNSKDSTAV
jgi:hypothetical protein